MAASFDDSVEAVLVWSVAGRSDAVYENELREAADSHPNLEFVLHDVSESGLLDPGALNLPSPVSEYSVFLCGPVGMRKAFDRRLREMGVPRAEVHFEEFRFR